MLNCIAVQLQGSGQLPEVHLEPAAMAAGNTVVVPAAAAEVKAAGVEDVPEPVYCYCQQARCLMRLRYEQWESGCRCEQASATSSCALS